MMKIFGRKQPSATAGTSGLGSSISKGSNNNDTPVASTVTSLKESIATQEKRERHLEQNIEKLIAEARAKMAKKDKKGALFCMKRKKLYQDEIDKLANIKFTLETQVMKIESFTGDSVTVSAMEQARDIMKKFRENTSIEKVDDLTESIKEEMELADEISNALAQPMDPMFDEDELLAELEELIDEDGMLAEIQELTAEDQLENIVEEQTPTQETGVDVPSHNATEGEEEELKQLTAELAL